MMNEIRGYLSLHVREVYGVDDVFVVIEEDLSFGGESACANPFVPING